MAEKESTFFMYIKDLVDVFYLILNSEAVQNIFKRYVTDTYNELEENLL
jgi:hypothetical protein